MSFLKKLGLTDDESAPPPPKDKPAEAKPKGPAFPNAKFPPAPVYPSAIASFQAEQAGILPPQSAESSDEAYKRIFAQTDFDGTEIGQTIKKFRDPLEALPLSPTDKFKAAIAQAQAQAGVTAAAVLGVFTTLQNKIGTLKTEFDERTIGYRSEKIEARQQRIEQIDDEMAKLQEERIRTHTELLEAENKSARVQAQFAAAVQRRSEELQIQEQQFATLLKG